MADKKIPGIHNFCDRWCERCAFGSRCAIYEDPSKQKDMSNQEFWDRLAVNFSKAKEKLIEMAAEHGIDLEAATKEMDDVLRKQERVEMEGRNHPISKLVLEYSHAASDWLKDQPGMEESLISLRENLTMGVESFESAKAKADTITDCIEVIRWYHTLLPAKLMRAVMGKADAFDLLPEGQRDYDGSAKVSLICIERSMQAWTKLFDLMPDREDDFLKILRMLERLKQMTLAEFPDAIRFVRPGFDE